jgi:hypothetical protein
MNPSFSFVDTVVLRETADLEYLGMMGGNIEVDLCSFLSVFFVCLPVLGYVSRGG